MTEFERAMTYPEEMTPAIRAVLEQPCFVFIDLARLWRETGADIGCHAEDEQSFFLHLQLKLALTHGRNWPGEFGRLVQQRLEIVKRLSPKAPTRKPPGPMA